MVVEQPLFLLLVAVVEATSPMIPILQPQEQQILVAAVAHDGEVGGLEKMAVQASSS